MAKVPMSFRVVLILAIGMLVGFSLAVGRSVNAERDIQPAAAAATTTVPWQDARLLAEVLERVRRDYVDNISDEELIEAAIRGMMADLDPHSAFLDPAQFKEIRISTTGEYSGVGIEVAAENGVIKVVSPMEDGPAARAGVLAGDTLLAIDDMPINANDFEDVIERMRGATGTTVKMTLARGVDPTPLEFKLARASVQVHSVNRKLLEPGIGYVRISHFSETTATDLNRALAALKKENGTALRGLLLDLRNNPGGLLEAAVGVSDTFLDHGIIVTASGRAADAKFEMDAQPGDAMQGAPIIVLVNAGSASASEIVAGALKDHDRARLVGQKTYGKGSVQTVVPLSDGRAIKLTTSRYFTPSGASIQERGIIPDVVVSAEDIKAHSGDDAKNKAEGDPQTDYELRVALGLLDQQRTIRQSRAP